MQMVLHVDANECKKEEKKKKNLLGHVNANVLCADALRVDVLYGDVDGGSCRVGADECKEKKNNLLKPGWMRACGCIVCGRGSYWMWLVGDADESKAKKRKEKYLPDKMWMVDADGGCGWWMWMVVADGG